MNPQTIIEAYFASWIKKSRAQFETFFDTNTLYSACYGSEYQGLAQIVKWFDDWNKRGSVLAWDITNLYRDNEIYIAEWYFKCEYAANIDEFNGVSLIRFNKAGKMISVKEFQSKAEHWLPYA